eukprot:RCo017179
MQSKLSELLSGLGVPPVYHNVLSTLCGHHSEFLQDIQLADLQGAADDTGAPIPAPVARGLLRKLQSIPPGAGNSAVDPTVAPDIDSSLPSSSSVTNSGAQIIAAAQTQPLQLTVTADPQDEPTLLRLGVKAMLPQSQEQQEQILTIILDRSGSMDSMWPLVMEAVVAVLTESVLVNPALHISLVFYNHQALELPVPRTVAALQALMKQHSPAGTTSFGAAFEAAARVIERQCEAHPNASVCSLLFTDGHDTSMSDGGSFDMAASAQIALQHGETFKAFLRGTGRACYTCVAAFGADHNPELCQKFGDRYYYIDRMTTVQERLVGAIEDLLATSGQCTLTLDLPHGFSEEELGQPVPLGSSNILEHHVWIRAPTAAVGHELSVKVVVSVRGGVSVAGTVVLCPDPVSSDSFQGRSFLLDSTALMLRKLAAVLAAGRPSAAQLTDLQNQLVKAKERLTPIRAMLDRPPGSDVKITGRFQLLRRLEEVAGMSARLSYALGHFADCLDTRTIGAVQLSAILRDAAQHVPSISQPGVSAAAAALPPPKGTLTPYGRSFSTDAFSGCDAHELAQDGDALYFPLRCISRNNGPVAVENDSEIISHNAFVFLMEKGRQQDRKYAIRGTAGFYFSEIWMPLYISEDHFARARLLLPQVLPKLPPLPVKGEASLWHLFGRMALTHPPSSEAEWMAFVHKARTLRALSEGTCTPAGSRVRAFLSGDSTQDLASVVADACLVDLTAKQLLSLMQMLRQASLQRALEGQLATFSFPEDQRLALLWAFGFSPEDDCTLCDQPIPSSQESTESSFRSLVRVPFPIHVPGDITFRTGQRDSVLRQILCSTTAWPLAPKELATAEWLLSGWHQAVEGHGGTATLYSCLDKVFVESDTANLPTLQRSLEGVHRLTAPQFMVRDAFPSLTEIHSIVVGVAVPECSLENAHDKLTALLEQRHEKACHLVRAHPIVGSLPPLTSCVCGTRYTAQHAHDVWGEAATPSDPVLLSKAKELGASEARGKGLSVVAVDALVTKKYRELGGEFEFCLPFDTFIPGLHYHVAAMKKDKPGLSEQNAIAELLQMLRWDCRREEARVKLERILSEIWNGRGDAYLSSALWLTD